MKQVLQKKLWGIPVLALVLSLVAVLTAGGLILAQVVNFSNVWTSPKVVVNPTTTPPTTPVNSTLVLSSTWDTDTSATIGEPFVFELNLSNPSPVGAPGYTDAIVKFEISKATTMDASDVTLEYEVAANTWATIPTTLTDGKLVGYFGPAAGFDIPTGYNATTSLRATFATAGEYTATAVVVPVS